MKQFDCERPLVVLKGTRGSFRSMLISLVLYAVCSVMRQRKEDLKSDVLRRIDKLLNMKRRKVKSEKKGSIDGGISERSSLYSEAKELILGEAAEGAKRYEVAGPQGWYVSSVL